MYRLLLLDQDMSVQNKLKGLDWSKEGFNIAICPADREQAAAELSTGRYHAAACVSGGLSHDEFGRIMDEKGLYYPLFDLPDDAGKASATLKDVRHLLNRLHVDYSDDDAPQDEMFILVQEELMQNLLTGQLKDVNTIRRWFYMLRADIAIDQPCMIFQFTLPQGEFYMADRWHYGQHRLSAALARNFFDRSAQDTRFHVSFLNRVSGIILAIPRRGKQALAPELIEQHVLANLDDVKEYLDLDITIGQIFSIESLPCCKGIISIEN